MQGKNEEQGGRGDEIERRVKQDIKKRKSVEKVKFKEEEQIANKDVMIIVHETETTL